MDNRSRSYSIGDPLYRLKRLSVESLNAGSAHAEHPVDLLLRFGRPGGKAQMVTPAGCVVHLYAQRAMSVQFGVEGRPGALVTVPAPQLLDRQILPVGLEDVDFVKQLGLKARQKPPTN